MPANYGTICGSIRAIHGTNGIALYFQDAGTTQCQIQINADGSYGLYTPGGVAISAAAAGSWPSTSWHSLQFKIAFSNTVGTFQARLDGSTTDALNATGLNTRQGTVNSYFNRFRAVINNTCGLDDVVLMDTTGSANNNIPGDLRIWTSAPSGAGSSTQFTSSSGANYTQTGIPSNGDAGYVSSSTVGHVDLYAMGDLPFTPTTIAGVAPVLFVRKTDAGARTIAAKVKSGATTSTVASSSTFGQSYGIVSGVLEVDPNTSAAWTAAAVNAMEAGIEITA
jgi:hypothetical protein